MDDATSPSSNAQSSTAHAKGSEPELFSVGDGSYRAGIAAILLIAAILRLWGIDFGLPHLRSRPDEFGVVVYTAEPAQGNWRIDWPIYPHTYLYASALWGMAGLEISQSLGLAREQSYPDAVKNDKATVILIIRLLSALMGTLAVCVSIDLTRRVFGRAAALCAGLLVATNFLHARDSHVIKPDIFLSAAVLLTFVYVVPLARKASVRRGIAAGLAAGVAMAAKYPGILLAAPVYLAAWMGAEERGWRRILTPPAIATAIAAAGFFILSNPFVVFDQRNLETWQELLRANFPQLQAEAEIEAGVEVGVEARADAGVEVGVETGQPESVRGDWTGNARRFEEMRRIGGFDPFAERAWWQGFAHQARFSLRYGMGLVPSLLAPIALLWAVFFAPRRMRPFTWPAALFGFVYFVVFGISPAMVARYMTPLIPLLLILEAGLALTSISWLSDRFGFERRAALLLLAAATLLLGLESLSSNIAHNRLAARTDTRVLATRWLSENTPEGSRIKDLGTVFMPYGRPHVPKGRRASYAPPNPAALIHDNVSYVMTHDHILYSSSLDPQVLETLEPHLTLLAEFDPYEGATSPPRDAVFERVDPYYIPIHGFESVTRPGPMVRIYSFSPEEGERR